MDLVGQLVIRARDRDELLELDVQAAVPVSQDRQLPFDQGDRSVTGVVRQEQVGEEVGMAEEEFLVPLQEPHDLLVGERRVFGGVRLVAGHRLMIPSYTLTAGPVIHRWCPGPSH